MLLEFIMFNLDKQKYLRLLETEGLSAALTALHKDKEQMEQITFEGPQGYQRELWDYLEKVRNFSIELWNTVTETGTGAR